MIGLIVTGHGHFATGLKSALALLGGEPSDFVAVDFPDGDTTEDLAAKLKRRSKSLLAARAFLSAATFSAGHPSRPPWCLHRVVTTSASSLVPTCRFLLRRISRAPALTPSMPLRTLRLPPAMPHL